MPYEVFVSYAGDDRSDDMFKFFKAFATLIAGKRGIGEDAIFVDRVSFKPGEYWSPELKKALGEAKVFVYLHSPKYFRPDDTRSKWLNYCGREWAAFDERCRQNNPGSNGSLMVPVLWTPLINARGPFPPVAKEKQLHWDSQFGKEYGEKGLASMIFAMEEQKYKRFFDAFAEYVAKLLNDPALPNLPPLSKSIDEYDNAFNATQRTTASASTTLRVSKTARAAKFAPLIATRNEIVAVLSEAINGYDPSDPLSFQPFVPKDESMLWAIVDDAARLENLRAEWINADATLWESGKEHELQVLLVDGRSLVLEDKFELAQQFDKHPSLGTGAIVLCELPSISSDHPTLPSTFETRFRQAFASRLAGMDPEVLCHKKSESADDLIAEIRKLLVTLRNRIRDHRLSMEPTNPSYPSNPTLSGPHKSID